MKILKLCSLLTIFLIGFTSKSFTASDLTKKQSYRQVAGITFQLKNPKTAPNARAIEIARKIMSTYEDFTDIRHYKNEIEAMNADRLRAFNGLQEIRSLLQNKSITEEMLPWPITTLRECILILQDVIHDLTISPGNNGYHWQPTD